MELNKACSNSVFRCVNNFQETLKRVGRWADYSNSYSTMDNDYIESVWWVLKELNKNLEQHCIPKNIFEMKIDDYETFLEGRRKLIAAKIKDYYFSLYQKESKEESGDHVSTIQTGENNYIEFKSSLKWSYHTNQVDKKLGRVIAKSISSFMNSDGGKLFIGVNDDGEILGLENDYKNVKNGNADGFLLTLVEVINNFIGKEYHQYIIPQVVKIENKDVCIVEVLNSGTPSYVKDENKKKEFYIRASASSQLMDTKEANDYIKSHWNNI
jgi:hypothetical protein